mgnify:CR=1 FL=1
MNVHSSFLALSQAEIEAHVDELVAEHIDGAERARVLGYLNQTLAKDKAKVRGYRSVLARARRKLDEVHETAPIDYVKHTGLFTIDSSDRFTRMKAKLLVAGSDVRGKAGLAAVTENLVIEGNNIQLDGISNGLKAVDETLTCGLKVTGLCKIEGANDVPQHVFTFQIWHHSVIRLIEELIWVDVFSRGSRSGRWPS